MATLTIRIPQGLSDEDQRYTQHMHTRITDWHGAHPTATANDLQTFLNTDRNPYVRVKGSDTGAEIVDRPKEGMAEKVLVSITLR